MKLKKYEIPESNRAFKPTTPYMAKVLRVERLTEEGSDDDIRNIVLDLCGSNIRYIEGQSVGVIAPGKQENGRNHRPRLYSIASSRTGDDGNSCTVTLCVKRVLFTDPETGEEVRGLCSNYLCDVQEGDEVAIFGPAGRTFLLPEDDNVNLIMVAAGTGIAPFRAFLKRIYAEKQSWNGQVRLFFGAKTGMESIYMNRENDDIGKYMDQTTFKAFRALSRGDDRYHPEDESVKKGFVQHQMEDNQEEIWQMLEEGNFAFYLCGMKAMEQGVLDVFRKKAEEHGRDWDEMLADFKAQGRWNIETY